MDTKEATPAMNLLRTLKSWRLKQGITQVDLAKLMNTKQSTISEIESGKDCYVSTVFRYAEAMNCKVTILITPKS